MTETISVAEYLELNKEKKTRKQPEGQMQTSFGQMLNGILRHRLSPNLLYWTYSGAGEKKPKTTALWQKKKGLNAGDSDYRFEILKKSKCGCGNYYQYNIYLEFKSEKGTLTEAQKVFREKHKNIENSICYYPRLVEEAIEILEKEEVLLI